MRRNLLILGGILALILGASWALTLGHPPSEPSEETGESPLGRPSASPTPNPIETASEAERAEQARLAADFPLVGIVTAPQLRVRREAERDSLTIGWLRLGGRVRLREAPVITPHCHSGWYALHPQGWACAGQGIEVHRAGEVPDLPALDHAADRDAPLPYRYMFVRDPQTPEYHQLPSREDQRAALLHGARYAELLNAGQQRRAERLRTENIPGEPPSPSVVARYLHRGFYVASNGAETRSHRRFVRTVRGTYIKEAQLEETTGSDFAGQVVDDTHPLPLAWAVRTAAPLARVMAPNGEERLRADENATPWERLSPVPWLRREHIGARIYHVVSLPSGEERYLRAWFVGVAERRDPPRGIGDEDTWVHVDVSEQTLVLYRGPTPLYATLVSSGLDGHDTPRGEFTIRRKFISDTMANLGPDAGDDSYRIDDVPWTQYFDGSVALHGAFWHHRFGLQRSHGCVNLAPRDARYVFEHTLPEIPAGWHGVSTERGTGFTGTRVVITD